MYFWALILTALLCCIGNLCDGREVFGKVEGGVTLKPTVNQPITSITWKNGPNKAAEWEINLGTDYYTICRDAPRCQLNTTTGELTIMNLKMNEKLYFSAEINGIAAQSFFTVIALEPVSKPNVTHTCENNQCTLVCEGKNTTYTKYSWKEKSETIANDITILHVQKSDKMDKIYTCVFSNPVSTEESDPVKESNLFSVIPIGWIIAGVISFIVVVVCCGIFLFYKEKDRHKASEEHEKDPSPEDHLMGENPDNREDTDKFEDTNEDHHRDGGGTNNVSQSNMCNQATEEGTGGTTKNESK